MPRRLYRTSTLTLSGILLSVALLPETAMASEENCARLTEKMSEASYAQTFGMFQCKKGYEHYKKLYREMQGITDEETVPVSEGTTPGDKECAKLARMFSEPMLAQIKGKQCPNSYDYYRNLGAQLADAEQAEREAEQQRLKQQQGASEMGPYASLDHSSAKQRLLNQTGLTVYYELSSEPEGWETAKQVCMEKSSVLPASDYLKNHLSEINQFLAYQHYMQDGSKSLGTYIGDDINGYATFMNGKVGFEIVASITRGRITCKAASEDELAAFKQQDNARSKLIDDYAAEDYLAYWQQVVESDNEELKKLYQYSSQHKAKLHLMLANTRAQFKDKGQYFESTDSPGYYNASIYELSQNQHEWAISPDAGQQQSYINRLKGKATSSPDGLTQQGFEKIISDIKKQPLFQALDNLQAEMQEHKGLVTGQFTDRKGQLHTVSIHIRPTYSYIAIDSHLDY